MCRSPEQTGGCRSKIGDSSITQKGLSPEYDYKLEDQHSIEQKGEASDS